MSAFELDLPRKARDVLVPMLTPEGVRVRYRGLYGGRDGAKSHSIARMLLIRGMSKKERILCVREIQKSIADSVHRLLADLITSLGLEGFYDVQKNYILGKNGTLINFHGLSGETIMSLKSQEGTTIAWIEEAQTITKRSWNILEPTIRAANSELWLSFNPEMETDETYQRIVVRPPPDALVGKINWSDNPWRSTVLDAARERMAKEAPDDYAHVYEGHCRPAVEGAIYYTEVSTLKSSGRLGNVPYDPMLKVHVIVDLGFNDYMALILAQRLGSELRVIRYIEDRKRFIPSYHQELKDLHLNYGTLYLPHDGRQNHVTGSSAQEQFEALNWTVEIVPDIGIEQGIRKTREIFPRVYVDKTNASELLNRLGRYRRRVNSEGQASTPMHDDESNGADGFRYFSIIADQMSNDNLGNFDPLKGWQRGH